MPLKHIQRSVIPWMTLGLTLVVLLLLGLDSVGNPESTRKLIGVSSYYLVVPMLTVAGLSRWQYGVWMPQWLLKLFRYLLSPVVWFATVATLFDAVAPPNTLYALTRVNQSGLWLLTTTATVIFFINHTTTWWHRHWRKVLSYFPLFVFYVAAMVRLFPFDVFHQLVKEDKLVEYAQFMVLVIGGVGMMRLCLQLRSLRQTKPMLVAACIAAGFLLVAGDEISWGQRLIGFSTSEALRQVNLQEEVTVHNIRGIVSVVIYGYVGLSFLGLFGHTLSRLSRRVVDKRIFKAFAAPGWLRWYFVFPLIFFVMQLVIPTGIWHEWSELAELYLYAGLVCWAVLVGHHYHRHHLEQ